VGVSVARVGSLLTVFFRDKDPISFRESKECDTLAFGRVFNRMRVAGVLLPPSQFEAWFLATVHDDDVIDATLAAGST